MDIQEQLSDKMAKNSNKFESEALDEAWFVLVEYHDLDDLSSIRRHCMKKLDEMMQEQQDKFSKAAKKCDADGQLYNHTMLNINNKINLYKRAKDILSNLF